MAAETVSAARFLGNMRHMTHVISHDIEQPDDSPFTAKGLSELRASLQEHSSSAR
jgi:hypothetical protein